MQDYFRYINENWADLSPLHLAAYAMWRLTWIHPFEDGNGRTARAVSYFVLCVKYGRWLPGCGTFLQEINEDRASHYAILRVTDLLHQSKGRIELNTLEEHLADVLKVQLRSRL